MRPLPHLACLLLLVTAACPPAGPDAGTGPDGGPGAAVDGGGSGDGGGLADPRPPTLATAGAHESGRFGDDLSIRFQGSDPDGDVVSVHLRLLDAAGQEVPLFDGDWDGHPDQGVTRTTPLTSLAGEATFAGRALLPLVLDGPEVARVEVFLEDAAGLRSQTVTATLQPQSVKALGAPCDPEYVDDRCEIGLGCAGDPPTCSEGVAPTITRVGYYAASDGSRILVEGEDVDDDVEAVRIDFMDANGGAVQLDLDNDGVDESDAFEIDARRANRDGRFFVSLSPRGDFSARVARVAARAYDVAGRSGARHEAALEAPPTRYRGQACDVRGFDACADGSVCTPGLPDATNTCQSEAYVRSSTCRQVPVLAPSGMTARFSGRAEGLSLWDPPSDCTATDPAGMPEGIVLLRLAQPADRLVVTTDRPGTTFDTILYLLPGCPEQDTTALACGDDGLRTVNSTVELTGVAAGDYLIVVDAWDAAGGDYEVEVTIE